MTTPIDWASDDLTPPPSGRWDLVVVGGGTAGIVAAKTAARFGADVLLVERHRTGGDCLWTGCVPSKSLLAQAHEGADFAAAMAHVHRAVETIEPVDSPADLRAHGVRVWHGTARFTGPGSLDLDGTTVGFVRAVVATGSSPVVPPIDGLDSVTVLTSDTVWDLTTRPDRLLVVGGGPIGCELGQAMRRLGADVTIVEAGERILPREDADAAEIITATLRADGVRVLTSTSLERVTDGRALLSDGREVPVDAVLMAVGRRPGTAGLGLEAAGVATTEHGHVQVDDRLRTTNRRVWAAGDVSGHPALTHVAGVHGSTAATNAVLGLRRAAETTVVPRVTYTSPEVAAFGEGGTLRPGLRSRTIDHHEVDRAVTDGTTAGFSRLVLDRRGRVVGATVVGPRAGESLAEVLLAARHGLRARDIAASMHPYPTHGDGVWKAALEDLQDQLASARVQRVIGWVRRLRRRWS
ncbi:pyridine nucleotide-disulfide oxidoreductase [Aeromicrobium marinum DSM 15272]|uniref:Pyridine nucleotide-disulfide oxidoreductase n=1 Tax=Aeromicrobium marinum DSM 15272 TaxID=585531 RepID=E2SEY9_9ACTN|nr:FAD-dependent oxidoreductase [Aeromicrobium marinum]EFQ82233.1 pyridine nucleotide-disulfide oxidoreductase [Aeromicrobium marinum DSM 15272]